MLTVSLTQAKARLSELLNKVEAGQEIVITRTAARWLVSIPSRPSKVRYVWMISRPFARPCRGSDGPAPKGCAKCETKGYRK
jgi:hypothetical protein